MNTEIFISQTINHSEDSLFGKKYTVKLKQLYELILKINNQVQSTVRKRYSEIRQLFELVNPNQVNQISIKKSIQLPKFPEKSLFKMNSDLIAQRKNDIECWMNEVIKSESLSKYIYQFFNMQTQGALSVSKKLDPTDQVKNFIANMSSARNNKINLIEKFSWNFFSKKLQLKTQDLKLLIECLIPLCGDEFVGNKSLDFLFKLTTSDYYRDFLIACSQLVVFSLELLKLMKLNEYLCKRRFTDSQIQAYHISKLIHSASGAEVLNEILNDDQEAINVFNQWENKAPVPNKNVISNSIQDWRPLISLPDKKLSFRFVGRELDINGVLCVNTSIDRTIEYLTIPSERKKWDLRMQEMIRIPKDTGYVLIYAADKKLYEFHTDINIEKNEFDGDIYFNLKCYEFNKRNNTILGNMNAHYKMETIEDKGIVDCDGRKILKMKITWNSHFCEKSFSLLREDIFQEANILQRSFERLINILEFKDERLEEEKLEDGLLEKFERKKLGKTFSLESFNFLK